MADKISVIAEFVSFETGLSFTGWRNVITYSENAGIFI